MHLQNLHTKVAEVRDALQLGQFRRARLALSGLVKNLDADTSKMLNLQQVRILPTLNLKKLKMPYKDKKT